MFKRASNRTTGEAALIGLRDHNMIDHVLVQPFVRAARSIGHTEDMRTRGGSVGAVYVADGVQVLYAHAAGGGARGALHEPSGGLRGGGSLDTPPARSGPSAPAGDSASAADDRERERERERY